MTLLESKYIVYIVSIILILGGIDIISNPVWYSDKHLVLIDMTPIKWPFGMIFIFMGIMLFYREKKKVVKNIPLYTICPNCKETYFYNKLNEGRCLVCDIETVEINEYYD